MPVAGCNHPDGHFERDEPGDGLIFSGEAVPAVLGCSPGVECALVRECKIEETSGGYLDDDLVFQFLNLFGEGVFFPVKESPNVHALRFHFLHTS